MLVATTIKFMQKHHAGSLKWAPNEPEISRIDHDWADIVAFVTVFATGRQSRDYGVQISRQADLYCRSPAACGRVKLKMLPRAW
jgi:hypothetical protein